MVLPTILLSSSMKVPIWTKVPTPVILDNLIAASKIPPSVAVLIANPRKTRAIGITAESESLLIFCAKELSLGYTLITTLQTIRKNRGRWVSLGGLAAGYAGYKHPEVFTNVLCQSGSFWWAPDHSAATADGVITERDGWPSSLSPVQSCPSDFTSMRGPSNLTRMGPAAPNSRDEPADAGCLASERIRSPLPTVCWRPRLFELAGHLCGRTDRPNWKHK